MNTGQKYRHKPMNTLYSWRRQPLLRGHNVAVLQLCVRGGVQCSLLSQIYISTITVQLLLIVLMVASHTSQVPSFPFSTCWLYLSIHVSCWGWVASQPGDWNQSDPLLVQGELVSLYPTPHEDLHAFNPDCWVDFPKGWKLIDRADNFPGSGSPGFLIDKGRQPQTLHLLWNSLLQHPVDQAPSFGPDRCFLSSSFFILPFSHFLRRVATIPSETSAGKFLGRLECFKQKVSRHPLDKIFQPFR